jgi:hypothetical protein
LEPPILKRFYTVCGFSSEFPRKRMPFTQPEQTLQRFAVPISGKKVLPISEKSSSDTNIANITKDEHEELMKFARNLRRVKRRLLMLSVQNHPLEHSEAQGRNEQRNEGTMRSNAIVSKMDHKKASYLKSLD